MVQDIEQHFGISKNSDAIAVVVSEETGKISVAKNNILKVDIKEEGLKKLLLKYLLNIEMDKDSKQNDNIILRKMKKVKEKFRKKEIKQGKIHNNKEEEINEGKK